jgi:raffinose/stachyose/melibiose transport system permease protein
MSAETGRGRQKAATVLKYALCVLVALVVAVPLYVSVTGGFKTLGRLQSSPFGLPEPLTSASYTALILGTEGHFWRELGNSVVVAACTIGLSLVLCASAAFAIARIPFRASGLVFGYFILGLLFPLAVAILPLYLQLRNLGLVNTYGGVFLPQTAFQMPLLIMLLRGFFKEIPKELEDATALDGYGPIGFLYYVVLPLSTPILATCGVLTLVVSWNNFLLPLLVFNSSFKFTLPLGVMDFQGQYASQWNVILAFLTLAMIPAVLLFIFAQRYIVAGLTGGALKG